jgi:hypothetical protein
MQFHEALESIATTEKQLLDSYEQDVGQELRLVDSASALLLAVLGHTQSRTGEIEADPETSEVTSGDVETLRLAAQVVIGIRVLRVVRAGRAVLAFGYEREAPALARILVELEAHRAAIMDDDTGTEALAWLRRQRKYRIGKLVEKSAPPGLYDNLSADAHGDPTPVGRLLDPSTGSIELAPRRGPSTRASLLLSAGMARDQAVLIAKSAGVRLSGVDEFDRDIEAAWERLRRETSAVR